MQYILTIVSAIILTLPFDYPDLFFLSWFALIPFLYAIRNSSPGKGMFFGYILGIFIFLRVAFWVYFPLVEFSGLPWIVCITLYILLFLMLGTVYGVWAWLFRFVSNKYRVRPFWLAISWTAIEYLRFKLISALPFGFVGYTQANFTHLLQLVDLGGIFLISFIVILINGYLYKIIVEKSYRVLIPLIFIFTIIITYGSIQLGNFDVEGENKFRVGIVQTSLDPVEKWEVNNIVPNIQYLSEKSQEMNGVDLLIWPESSLTFDLIRNEFYREKLWQYLQGLNSSIQAGSLAVKEGTTHRYNSSFLLDPKGKIKARYNKNRLVPFGEYIPLAGVVKFLTGLEMSGNSGETIKIFKNDNVSWKTSICSEILYPQLVKRGIKKAAFVVNQSNEAWYKRGNLQEQMWIAAVFRAVENRCPVVRSGNMAYGGIIKASGRPAVKYHSRGKSAFEGKVPLVDFEGTLYQRWGNYFGYITATISLLLLVIKSIILYKRNN